MDVHEALLTKEHVRTVPEWSWLINNPKNCILRHHETLRCWHTPGVGGDEIFQKCALQLCSYEGIDEVRQFLIEMRSYYPHIATAQLQRFDLVTANLKGE